MAIPFRRTRILTLPALTVVLLVAWSATIGAAGWTPVTNLASDFSGTMLLLSDGRVMVQGYSPGNNWMLLTPSSTGSYIAGTWTTTAPMSTPRLYFASNILRSGNVWVLGGEYAGVGLPARWSATGEIYNPVANAWTPIATYPPQAGCPGGAPACFGDDPSVLLDGDRILAGNLLNRNTFIYDIASNTWGPAIPKFYNDQSDEETWVKLADGRILTYDLFRSIATGGAYAEVFDPVSNTWAPISPSDGTAFGTIPQLSSAAMGFEVGPGLRLQDGRIFLIGATGRTALYNPSMNTWAAGPDVRDGSGALYGATDAPATVLPNGHVFFTADASPQFTTPFHAPTKVFDFNPATNTIALALPPPAGTLATNLAVSPVFITRMLILPTGQVLVSDSSNRLWVYTPDGPVNPAMRPVLNKITDNGGGNYTLTGKQLNGQSAGSSYGDDAENDENYPMIRLTSTTTGTVFYTRSTNWSTTGVGPGPETVDFKTPVGMPSGRYSVVAVGAGIASFPIFFNIP